MQATIRILLVDDHAVVREGLRLFLEPDERLVVVGEAANGKEALTAVAELQPDVVLMDLLMPVMDGVSATRELKARFPEVEVIAVTSVLEDHLVVDAVQAGAMSYLLKDTDADALIEAIYAAGRGEVRLHPEAAKRLVKEVRTADMRESLTARETDILRLVGKGQVNKEIAQTLGLSELTVKTHVSRLLSKLNVSSRTQAALEITDDGVGFSPDAGFPGHLGLSSMRERAELLGGTLEIYSAPGRGTTLRATLPLGRPYPVDS